MTSLPTAFLSPGGGEFLLIMLALILLFGAKDAPRILRKLHEMLDKLQRTAASFRYQIMYGDSEEHTPEKPYEVYTEDSEPDTESADSEEEPLDDTPERDSSS